MQEISNVEETERSDNEHQSKKKRTAQDWLMALVILLMTIASVVVMLQSAGLIRADR